MLRTSIPWAVAVCLFASGAARADPSPVPDRGQMTVGAGLGLSTGHVQNAGVVGSGPVLYGGLEVQVRLKQPLGVGVLLGGADVTGWMLGANLRAEAHVSPRVFLSAGAGPWVAASGGLAGLLLVEGDATLSVRFTTNAALMFGPLLAVATNHEGTPRCGVDTCRAWAVPGDRLFVLRLGAGAAF